MSGRPVDKIVTDLLDAVGAASELVERGRDAYDTDRLLRLAGEAVIGRIGDSAAKLRDQHGDDLPREVPWDDVIADRIIVDHVYHRGLRPALEHPRTRCTCARCLVEGMGRG